MGMKSSDMIRPLLRHFNWQTSRIIPECTIDGGIADLLIITKAGYLTEVEIKVSLSDWKADADKWKWTGKRERISRFFYAVPVELAGRAPDNLPFGAGILSVRLGINVVRPAVRTRAKRIEPEEYGKLMEAFYWRFWKLRFSLDKRTTGA